MKRSLRYALSVCVCVAAVASFPGNASADISQNDFKLVTKAIGFLKTTPSGDLNVAIVYDPGNAASKSDADALNGILGAGLSEKGVNYKPVMVEASNLSAISSAGVVYVAAGMGAQQAAIGGAAKSAKVISVSSDKSCVESGNCTMYVASSPKVEIVVNKGAAEAAGVEFQSAFKMMISEI